MIRKQVYLTRENEKDLKKHSKKLRTSEAFLIREAIYHYCRSLEKRENSHPLDAVIGISANGRKDGSINHDHYLYGAPKKWK